MTSIPVNLQNETSAVFALLDSGYQPPKYMKQDVAFYLRRHEDDLDVRAALVWLIDHEPDVLVVIGALVQYALMDRGLVAGDATYLEANGYVAVIMDRVLRTLVRETSWQTGATVREALIPSALTILVPVNVLIKRLATHTTLSAVVQHPISDGKRFPVGGRTAILTRDEEFDVRYQPAAGVDPTLWERGDACWGENGMFRAEDRHHGYLVKQFRTFFPAYAAEFMLRLADEDQWHPSRR
jgi:hypothetical protein